MNIPPDSPLVTAALASYRAAMIEAESTPRAAMAAALSAAVAEHLRQKPLLGALAGRVFVIGANNAANEADTATRDWLSGRAPDDRPLAAYQPEGRE